MRDPSSIRALARFMRRYASLAIVPLAGMLLLISPTLAAACLLIAVALLLAERFRQRRHAAAMRDALKADRDLKLEVSAGILGDLAHHINRLRQHYRSQQRLLHLLGVPGSSVAAQLADLDIPPHGRPCNVAVLAISTPYDERRRVESLREIAVAAQQQAEQHGALIERIGDSIVLIFGAFEHGRPEQHLRAAHQAAVALYTDWNGGSLSLSLAGGSAEAVILAGIGYSIIGAPIDQALALLAAGQPAALVCSEPTYIYLRRLGSAPPLSVAPRLQPVNQAPTYSVPLARSVAS